MNKFLLMLNQKKQSLNMSYRQIAKIVGLSHTSITRVFQGEGRLTLDTCFILAKWLEIDSVEAFKLAGLLSDREAVK